MTATLLSPRGRLALRESRLRSPEVKGACFQEAAYGHISQKRGAHVKEVGLGEIPARIQAGSGAYDKDQRQYCRALSAASAYASRHCAIEASRSKTARKSAWVLAAEAQGMDYGLRLPGVEIPPDQGAAHRLRCLQALALWGQ